MLLQKHRMTKPVEIKHFIYLKQKNLSFLKEFLEISINPIIRKLYLNKSQSNYIWL